MQFVQVSTIMHVINVNIITLFRFNSPILVENFVVGTCNSCMFLVFHEFEMKYSAGV